ncbi:similar to Saccharomyces cerevisiae YER153C PET122 Mitochondrial translational activator specific for the COX3 mRNA, acts together with Pet54p and Pet494 [Maudiozyma saulgeensis]|uniref:Similar to Saccharomyces cerevisiae YER153C PET122 Mitochondrial translational activator specific for the COX3 mRNA, acts together with Pet54p and Pet494 n=1 Tax=Maudiozyma saulgeensis TaxID=1789683 RepID=A0A1X7R7P7_9SACH|nr:similar to Saccharomyces cerevisiae YER153C PET122 Mitochondrial translational activator specific for the COX3 mRNA, acts together with Pet54p and Pet494 [Kazachstania saulgeensis]
MVSGVLRRYDVLRRFMSEDVRKQLYVGCLNRNFDSVLTKIRPMPTNEMDYGFLQLYLVESCFWGHMESVDYIWHKYVMNNQILIIRPHILCAIGNLALTNQKFFVTKQIYEYFERLYGSQIYDETMLHWKYELLRIKIESFASGTGVSTSFSEKWKIFLEDVDHNLPITTAFHVRDFPHMIKALASDLQQGSMTEENILEMLFTEKKISIKNPSTLPLLLNLILLQPTFSKTFKFDLFRKFYETHPQLNHDDSLIILFKLLKGDDYNLSQLVTFATQLDNGKLRLTPQASRLLNKGISNTEHSRKLGDSLQETNTPATGDNIT